MSDNKGNIQISIHAGLVDTRSFDQSMLDDQVQAEIVQKYHTGGLWRKIVYYFGEKEVKAHLADKYRKQLTTITSQNLFFHPERTAFAHRSNIAYHYKLGDGKQKRGESFSHDAVRRLCNEYILSTHGFAGMSDADADKMFIDVFSSFVKEDKGFVEFAKKNCKNYILSSDLLYQLKSYRANISLVQTIRNDNNLTLAQLQKLVAQYINNYQQLPLFMRLLELHFVDQSTWSLITSESSKTKLEDLLHNVYDIQLTVIDPTNPVGSIKVSQGSYSSRLTKIGLGWKWLPRRAKVLTLGGLVGATALLGGRAILLLPLIIFIKQFVKTKADYIQNIQAYMNRFVTHNQVQKEKKDILTGNKALGKAAKDTEFVYTKLQPQLLENPVTASELVKNILLNALTLAQQDQLKQQVDVALAHIQYQEQKKLATFVVTDPRTKEQEVMLLYKAVVLGASLVGYELHSTKGIKEYQTSRTFNNFFKTQDDLTKTNSRAFNKHANSYALQDGLMSGVVSGFTGWLGGYMLTPGVGSVAALASSELVELTIDNDSPLYDWLLENNMDPATHQFNDEDIRSILDANTDVRLEGENFIYTSDSKVLDVKLIGELQEILPIDTYNQFIERLMSDQSATLWDTLTDIAGYTDGNQYSHDIVEQIWQADGTGASEIFLRSVENGLPVTDLQSAEWSEIMAVLDKTYDYQGFEEYSQWANKQRVGDTMQKLSENNFAIEELAQYTNEQRAVLTHAAFVYLDTNDLKDILLDYSGQEEIIGSMSSLDDGTNVGSGNVSGSGSTSVNNWLDFGTPEYTGQLQSTPLPFGKNTFIEEPTKKSSK